MTTEETETPDEQGRGEFCHYCGEEEEITIETCHIRCDRCGGVSNGCGD